MKYTCIGKAAALTFGLIGSGFLFNANEARAEVGMADDNPIGFYFDIGVEAMAGDTTYSIGGDIMYGDGSLESVHFPISELAWPMDIWLTRFDAGLNVGSAFRFNGTVKTNFSEPDDPMVDKDWLSLGSPGQLDVYSESTITNFDAFIFDIDAEWVFYETKPIQFYTGVGYMYQNFDYEARLIQQYSPSGRDGFYYDGDGTVGITYDITYDMLYFLIGSDFQVTPQFSLAGMISYSPFVGAEDEDRHLLRDKVSLGDMDGSAFMLDLSGRYNFLPSWYLEAGFQYTSIEVDGTQRQTLEGIALGQIYMESESSQTSGYLTVGFNY